MNQIMDFKSIEDCKNNIMLQIVWQSIFIPKWTHTISHKILFICIVIGQLETGLESYSLYVVLDGIVCPWIPDAP